MKLLLINNDSDTWGKLVDVATAHHEVAAIHHSEIMTTNLSQFDAAILSGGWWYDDETELLENYAQELELIRISPLPILGICIGMQLMHVALDQAVPLLDTPQSGDQPIQVLPEGQELFGFSPEITVFKNHTRGVIEADPSFQVLAMSPGHIEIMRHRTRPLLGVQYHPEVGPFDEAVGRIDRLVTVLVRNTMLSNP